MTEALKSKQLNESVRWLRSYVLLFEVNFDCRSGKCLDGDCYETDENFDNYALERCKTHRSRYAKPVNTETDIEDNSFFVGRPGANSKKTVATEFDHPFWNQTFIKRWL